jgi:23S rRNA (cytosine1962-C5)-methyltransferase
LDRYLTPQGSVLVLQISTAGLERTDEQVLDLLSLAVGNAETWKKATVIVDRSSGSRELEGLPVEEPKILKKGAAFQATTEILVRGVPFRVDFLEGQKTGFFLDQAENAERLARRLEHQKFSGTFKILDLCSYVGQWSVQTGLAVLRAGGRPQVTLVDSSARALERASENLARSEIPHELLKRDVLQELGSLPTGGFDLVIADPPALIQGRKHVPAGSHAYLQLNTEAFRLVRDGGLLVSCSCSGLLERERFESLLSKAAYRNKKDARWVEWGGQASDHPLLMEFPEGRYLKFGLAWVKDQSFQ